VIVTPAAESNLSERLIRAPATPVIPGWTAQVVATDRLDVQTLVLLAHRRSSQRLRIPTGFTQVLTVYLANLYTESLTQIMTNVVMSI